MTDEVQPLTWQKTTNAKEHQQFFSKINEIIDNLAPTVEEAEAATATANAAIADANTAIGNANAAIATADAAIATADAASSEATTAAETVAGYAARLSAIESAYIRNMSDTTQTIDSDVQVVNGHSLAVAGDLDVANDVNAAGAEIANAAFEKNGTKTTISNENGLQIVGTTEMDVADTTTGVRSLAAVNGKRLQNDLDAYEAMLRTTGSQTKTGVLTLGSTLFRRSSGNVYGVRFVREDVDITEIEGTSYQDVMSVQDVNDNQYFRIQTRASANGITAVYLYVRNSDGTYKQVQLAIGDVIS